MLNKILLGLMATVIVAMGIVGVMALTSDKEQPVAKVSKLRGAALVRTAEGMQTLENGSLVYAAQQIIVKNGRMRLEFADGTFVILGQQTRVSVQGYQYDDETGVVNGTLQFVSGALRAVTGRQQMKRNLQIKDQIGATIGIRGTDVFVGNIEPGVLDVFLVQSKLGVSVKNNQGGVLLESGEGTTLRASDVAPTEPKRWPQAKVDKALALVAGA